MQKSCRSTCQVDPMMSSVGSTHPLQSHVLRQDVSKRYCHASTEANLLSATGRGGTKLNTGLHENRGSRLREELYLQGDEVEADVIT